MIRPTLTLPLSLTALAAGALAIVAKLFGYDTVAAIGALCMLMALVALPSTWRD